MATMHLRILILLPALALLPACAAKQFDDPVAVMTDRSTALNWRWDAARQAERQQPRSPARIAALNELLWQKGHPDELRVYAIDQLVELDEADLRQKLNRRIVLIPEGQPIEHLFAVALKRKWDDFTAPVVMRWAVPVKGVALMDRREKQMIETLNPGRDVVEVVFEVFSLSDEQITHVQRVAAWGLLNELTDRPTLVRYLNQSLNETALVVDLKAAAADLHTLPRNREEVLWLSHLRDPSHADWWQRAKQAVAALSPAKRDVVELRHLPWLLRADAALLQADRATLYNEIDARLRTAEHHNFGPNKRGILKDYPQGLHDWADELTWADLAAMRVLWDAVNTPAVRDALFEQAEYDRKDTSAEHGGVIDFDNATPIAKAYSPVRRLAHDHKFVPSQAMITHCYTALAHYHFHAQSHRNADYAGPGYGDLQTAERLPFNFLVFTFVDEDRLNVDYYRHGGVVVDLGTIRRVR